MLRYCCYSFCFGFLLVYLNSCSQQALFEKSDRNREIKTNNTAKNDRETENARSEVDRISTDSSKTDEKGSDVNTPIMTEQAKEAEAPEELIEPAADPAEAITYTLASECADPAYVGQFNDLSPSTLDANLVFPSQTYNPMDKDSDLSVNAAASDFKSNESILIRGMLRTDAGTPLTGAVIDIIQDAPNGNS